MRAPQQDADRRPVTVLFADLSGFTALAERLDPEDVRALQTDLFDTLRGALEPLGAFIEKFVGDAVVAVFGAPQAHEDDPGRAMRAALEMHRRAAALSRRWERKLGSGLALHIGVNTGRVVAGRLGSDPQASYAVTGDAVNTAARLQSAAQAGETLVSRATYLLAQHAFTFAPAGELSLKGKSEPLAAYRLLGAADAPRPARGLESLGFAAPLVGRDAELAQMRAAFRGALSGRAQVLGIRGDPGNGKSRLVAEFLAQLRPLDGQTVTLRRAACSSLGEPPYGVMAQFFREGYGVDPADTLETAQRKIEDGLRALGAKEDEALGVAPIVGYVLGIAAGEAAREIEPERLSRQILHMLRIALERRLSQGTLLLVVEDLQWADTASLEGLSMLADWLADRPLMLLATYRSPFEGIEGTRAAHGEIKLGPLPAPETDNLLRTFFGQMLPEGLHRQLVERSGGNPFYLEELVRGLIARGALAREDGRWKSTAEPAMLDIPATIEGLLLSRIDRLEPEVRATLQEASVLGPVFEADLLARVGGRARMLDALCEAGLLESCGTGTYAFIHALLHDVVYQNLLQRRRAELHGRAGAELERLHGTHPQRLEDLEALGHHLSLSEHRARGARYLIAAGDWARGIYANEDAVRHYRRALAALEGCENCELVALEAHERLGDLLGLTGQRAEALVHYGLVRDGAVERSERIAQARLCRKIGALHWDAGEREQGLASFQEGLALLQSEGEPIERAHLYQEMGRLAFRSGDNRGALNWAERALAEARSSRADGEAAGAVAQALNTLGVAMARLGREREAVGHIEQSVGTALERGMLQAACRSYANLGVLYASLDPGRAIQTCLTGLETAKKIGDLGFQSRLYANLAVAYCALTDRCDVDGLRAAEEAIALDRKLGQLDHLAVPLIVLGQIHQCHGEPQKALEYYREALALAEEIREPQLLFPCYDGLATLFLDLGDAGEAERYLIKAAAVAERAGLDRDSLVVLPFLC
ncbi:MAG TPA: adenylate/guanylate cyclase domain-containing protein [Burkholderiales bacterium]|nr:adenylate/guanylate cyclase domain-containing protein [Burkholderiales bacterium]